MFNYCANTKSGYIIYNTLYNSLVRLSENEYQCYQMQTLCPEELKKQFIETGLWVDTELDERNNLLRYCYYLTKYQKAEPQITVTTTLDCNARCFYCYEHGVCKKKIQESTIDNILSFIQTLDTSNGIKLNWFGGEPLMNTDCIDVISERLKELNIDYTSYIITNGSLITDEIIEKMSDLWNTKDIQITIDGTEEVYSKRKNYIDDNGDYFDLLWKIKKVSDQDIRIHIRVNIDADNSENVCYLMDDLEGFFGKNRYITYYPAFLEGSRKPLSDNERVEIIKNIFNSVKDRRKLTVNDKLYSPPKVSPCMFYDHHSYTIDVDGFVYRCEHLVGMPENSMGNIEDFSESAAAINVLHLRDQCMECVFLPKCMGGCTSNYENGDVPCMIEKYMIQAYVELL